MVIGFSGDNIKITERLDTIILHCSKVRDYVKIVQPETSYELSRKSVLWVRIRQTNIYTKQIIYPIQILAAITGT